MIINLKDAVERGQNAGTSYSLNISAIDFGVLDAAVPEVDFRTKSETQTSE